MLGAQRIAFLVRKSQTLALALPSELADTAAVAHEAGVEAMDLWEATISGVPPGVRTDDVRHERRLEKNRWKEARRSSRNSQHILGPARVDPFLEVGLGQAGGRGETGSELRHPSDPACP
jgi:hypothetical protein